MNLIFSLLINVEGFFKILLSFQMCVARHAHNAQNIKFAASLSHLNKVVRDVAYFLYADKHDSLLKIEIMNLRELVKYKFPK